MKHGYSGSGRVLPPDMELEVVAELAVFEKQHRPRNPYEKRLVEQAALASIRKVRLLSAELRHTADRHRRAREDWDHDREDRLADLVADLDDEPAEIVRLLHRFTEGCDWLGDAWNDLADALDRQGFWDDAQARRALRLLGHDRPPQPLDDPAVVAAWKAILALRLPRDPEAARRLLLTDANPEHVAQGLPGPDQARDQLARLAADQRAEAAAEADRLWQELDAPARDEAPERALFDPGPEAARLHRYLTEADRLQRRALSELARLRRDDSDRNHATTPTDLPAPVDVPQNPPIEQSTLGSEPPHPSPASVAEPPTQPAHTPCIDQLTAVPGSSAADPPTEPVPAPVSRNETAPDVQPEPVPPSVPALWTSPAPPMET